MGRIRTIARRTFLVGAVAIAGGVAFGTYMVRKPHDNPLAEGLDAGEATFNPWVKIDSDKTIITTVGMSPRNDPRGAGSCKSGQKATSVVSVEKKTGTAMRCVPVTAASCGANPFSPFL